MSFFIIQAVSSLHLSCPFAQSSQARRQSHWQLYSDECAVKPDIAVIDRHGRKVLLETIVPTGFYWIHHIQEPDKARKWSETIWFWPAAKPFVASQDLVGYIVRDKGGSYRLLEEFLAANEDEKGGK